MVAGSLSMAAWSLSLDAWACVLCPVELPICLPERLVLQQSIDCCAQPLWCGTPRSRHSPENILDLAQITRAAHSRIIVRRHQKRHPRDTKRALQGSFQRLTQL